MLIGISFYSFPFLFSFPFSPLFSPLFFLFLSVLFFFLALLFSLPFPSFSLKKKKSLFDLGASVPVNACFELYLVLGCRKFTNRCAHATKWWCWKYQA